jgi:hypothetical protein
MKELTVRGKKWGGDEVGTIQLGKGSRENPHGQCVGMAKLTLCLILRAKASLCPCVRLLYSGSAALGPWKYMLLLFYIFWGSHRLKLHIVRGL